MEALSWYANSHKWAHSHVFTNMSTQSQPHTLLPHAQIQITWTSTPCRNEAICTMDQKAEDRAVPSPELRPFGLAAPVLLRKQESPFFSYSRHSPCLWRAAPSQAAASLRGSWASVPSGGPCPACPQARSCPGFPRVARPSSRLWSVTERLLI